MSYLNKQYIPEFDYYCAINKYRGTFSQWLKWRNTNALAQMIANENWE